MLSPKRRVEIALAGRTADKVPFTSYEKHFPLSLESALRARGFCVCVRRSVMRSHRPNVKSGHEEWEEGGRRMIRTWQETPVGSVSSLTERAGISRRVIEYVFKTPEDFKTLLFIIQDEQFEPDYAAYAQVEREWGDRAIVRAGIGLEPMQTLISGGMFSITDYSIQWMDNRDEILKLYDAIVENRRKQYPIVAASPASHANYGGNVIPDVIGPRNFEEYFVPHYNEAAEALHKGGVLIGCHFDDDCALLAEAIAGTDLDYIEAFTPAPDTDMTLGEARAAWPDKVIWPNFPSSVHLSPDGVVEQATVDLLEQLPSSDGIIMGITEDVPQDRWEGSFVAIMDGLDRHASERPERYRPDAT